MPKFKLHPKSKKELTPHTLWLFRLLVRHGKLNARDIRGLFVVQFPKLKKQQLCNSLMALQRVGVAAKARPFGQGSKDGAYRITARGRYVSTRLQSKIKKTLDNGGNLT
jgi:hypothetical protein